MIRPLLLLATTGFVATRAIQPLPEQQSVAGYVLDVRGRWVTAPAPAQPLLPGRALSPGTVVQPAAGAEPGDYVTIVLRDRRAITRRCLAAPREQVACDRPFRVPSLGGSSAAGRLIDAILAPFSGQREPPSVPLLARGGEAEPRPRDAVLELGDSTLLLAPALEAVPPGSYTLMLRPLETSAPPTTRTLQYRWDPARPRALRVAKFPPGVYELRLAPGATVSAWILATSPESYDSLSSAFAVARRIVRAWTREQRNRAGEVFLRAALLSTCERCQCAHLGGRCPEAP